MKRETLNKINDRFLSNVCEIFGVPYDTFRKSEKTRVAITAAQHADLLSVMSETERMRSMFNTKSRRINPNWCEDAINKHFILEII